MNSCKPSLPCKVDGVFGVNAIAALWQQHHNKLFNCVLTEFYQVDNVEGVSTIKTHEVYQVIQKLSVNKSTGMDSVPAEHPRLASPRLAPLLTLCFTAMMVHGCLPDSMMSVLLVPVVKDKAGKVSSSDNYRPIALASVLCKLVEHILLERVST